MKIGILGSGVVGQTLGSKFVSLGHESMLGCRSAHNEKAVEWVNKTGKNAKHGTFSDAASFGDIVFNCTKGDVSIEVIKAANVKNLAGKVLVDVANPLDFSHGMPPVLIPSLCNTTSLGEEIQKLLPNVKVVKALNTMNCVVMINPALVPGQHDLFICGNDMDAKLKVTEILQQWGWNAITDLGDITSSRAMEALLPIWIRLMMLYKSPNFNFHIAR